MLVRPFSSLWDTSWPMWELVRAGWMECHCHLCDLTDEHVETMCGSPQGWLSPGGGGDTLATCCVRLNTVLRGQASLTECLGAPTRLL